MFSYAAKRISRGGSLFLALFLSVTLAATLFSGILHGADAVGVAMLDKALEATDVDIISSAENRNLTEAAPEKVEEIIGGLEHVIWVDRLIRWEQEFNTMALNASIPFTIVAIDSSSSLMTGIQGVEELELGRVYIEATSNSTTSFQPGETAAMKLPTYAPFAPPGFETRWANFTVGGIVELDDRTFSLAIGEVNNIDWYALFLRFLLQGRRLSSRRPTHNLIIMSEETLRSTLDPIYGEMRRPTKVLKPEIIVGLDREILNPWDISASSNRVRLIWERVNSVGAEYGYVPVNYLREMLAYVNAQSARMKTNTMMVVAPVLFTAWYLGITVSDISLGLRRREIGLLLTRGLTHRQVFYIFLFEALLVSIVAGAAGVLMGAVLLPLVVTGMRVIQPINIFSPVTVVSTIVFSSALTLLSVYKPAKMASGMEIVEALKEFQAEEVQIGSWHEPFMALILGGYKMAMLLLGISVESFRTSTSNIIIFLLYSTWWGVDFILTYIGPILFFWGFIKLFIQYSTWFNNLVGKIAGVVVGDIAHLSILSARRNARRTAASTFMAALILGYGFSVIGSLAGNDDFTARALRMTVGADASVWLFTGKEAESLAEKITEMDGVASATVETWFEAESGLGTIPLRAIDPLEWSEAAYLEAEWLEGADAFERMNGSDTAVIVEKGAAKKLGVELNGIMLVKQRAKIHSLTVVGLFGREPWESWTLQNPTVYVPETFLSNVKKEYLRQTRILVKLETDTDIADFVGAVENLDPDIEGVDVAEEHIREASSNIFLVGPRRMEELGIYFAALVSSVGVALIVSTALRSRWKELTIMTIRGFSAAQLSTMLLVESMSSVVFAMILGFAVGFISLRGETEIFNTAVAASLERHMVFPPSSQLSLIIVTGLLIVSTVVPIIVAARRVSGHPMWRIEE